MKQGHEDTMMGSHPGGRVTASSVRCSIFEYLMVGFIFPLGSVSPGGFTVIHPNTIAYPEDLFLNSLTVVALSHQQWSGFDCTMIQRQRGVCERKSKKMNRLQVTVLSGEELNLEDMSPMAILDGMELGTLASLARLQRLSKLRMSKSIDQGRFSRPTESPAKERQKSEEEDCRRQKKFAENRARELVGMDKMIRVEESVQPSSSRSL
ncbi:hypothetical protein Bca52824_081729 [Brassica carinata]|uniref:Uncharacterized protein n=1 Tax=Brassica carinata TaxID=52824 RepID=A0A8X7PIF0_BRACI|nr:hypothetical protein Bca52824_081729 [Brassica carinata]